MKDGTYITIQSWMRTELDLKGNDLIIYAIIFGFSQTENTRFTGSLQYLADWCGATKQGVLKNIKSLLDKGLIEKNETFKDGVKFIEYHSTQLNTPFNSVEYPIKHSLTNNIDNNKNNKSIISKDIIESNNQKRIESFIDSYHSICVSLPKVRTVTDKRKRAILKIINKYSKSEMEECFRLAEESEFLTGNNDRGWKADIDFILREDKLIAILEGKYSNKKKSIKSKFSTDVGYTTPRANKENIYNGTKF